MGEWPDHVDGAEESALTSRAGWLQFPQLAAPYKLGAKIGVREA